MKKNEDVLKLVDRVKIYEASLDREISNEDTKHFVDSILENYFLDNDNINFLEKNGFNFFSISDDEMCLCLSAKLYSDCCKKELVLEKKDDYLSFVMAMASPDTYKTYLEMMKEISNNIFEVISKNEKCHFPNCDKKVTLNNLYHNEMSTKNDFVSNRKEMLFDNLYKMGEELFFDFKKDIFDYYGFCEEHNLVNKKIYFEDSHLLDSILYSSLEIVVFKLFQTKIIFESTLIEFKKYFNSFKEEGFKAYFVAGLRKISNFYKSLIMFYEKIKDSILDIQSTKLRMHVLSLPKTSTFFVKDVFAPPVNPKDFTVINSVNNVLQSPKIGVISTFTTKNYTMVYILIDKEDKKMNVWLEEYKKKILSNIKNEAAFVSNVSLILTDNIIFDKKWYSKLKVDEKKLYSALSKFRLEDPGPGQEYIKMKFFCGFDKGNNFF